MKKEAYIFLQKFNGKTGKSTKKKIIRKDRKKTQQRKRLTQIAHKT